MREVRRWPLKRSPGPNTCVDYSHTHTHIGVRCVDIVDADLFSPVFYCFNMFQHRTHLIVCLIDLLNFPPSSDCSPLSGP